MPGHEQTCRLVVAILHMAHTLDLHVCAKGIENQDQFEFFEELGCFKGQGFLIGKPMDMAQMSDYIRKYGRPPQARLIDKKQRPGESVLAFSGPFSLCYACAARSRASLRARSIRMAANLPRPFPEPCPFSKMAPTA